MKYYKILLIIGAILVLGTFYFFMLATCINLVAFGNITIILAILLGIWSVIFLLYHIKTQ